MGLTGSVGAARPSTAALRFAVEEERLRRLVDLFAGEAGLGRITAHDRLALFERQHILDVGKSIGRARFFSSVPPSTSDPRWRSLNPSRYFIEPCGFSR